MKLSEKKPIVIAHSPYAKEITYREAGRALKDRIKQAPSRKEAIELLEAIVPDVPPLPEDKIPSAND